MKGKEHGHLAAFGASFRAREAIPHCVASARMPFLENRLAVHVYRAVMSSVLQCLVDRHQRHAVIEPGAKRNLSRDMRAKMTPGKTKRARATSVPHYQAPLL